MYLVTCSCTRYSPCLIEGLGTSPLTSVHSSYGSANSQHPKRPWSCQPQSFFRNVTTTALFMYTALVWTTGSVIMQTTNTITLSLRINHDTYPTFAIAFTTYNMTNPSATMALFHWGSMRHFNKLLLILEHFRGLCINSPWERSWSILCTIHLTSRVRNEFPRCFTFLCESLQLILKLVECLYREKEKTKGILASQGSVYY